MRKALKLITLNIEGGNHLNAVIPFLQQQNPDVICLQEVRQQDLQSLQSILKMTGKFVPITDMAFINHSKSISEPWGIYMLTKYLSTHFSYTYYVGSDDFLPQLDELDPNSTCNRALLVAELEKEGTQFRIITTHFTWSPHGQSTPLQYTNLGSMLDILKTFDEFVLCGDFNAPRGRDIWSKIITHYKDNIPAHITTTIDPNLHRIKNLEYVVDGIFSTHLYRVTDVTILPGLSDHQAITATVTQR